jgi:hypothetical protein
MAHSLAQKAIPVVAPKNQAHCIYCGKAARRGWKGEHLVPEAIGGALTLLDISDNVVCTDCNNGPLSGLDKELCSRSYVSAIASQQIDAHLWQVWDVDDESDNLLVEAKPSWAPDGTMNCLTCYPQITLDRSGQHVRGDADEFRRFGPSEFTQVLFKAVRRCFDRYRFREKGRLHFERIESGVIPGGHRLAPRIFTRHSIHEIARNVENQSFILRFTNEEDKRFALNSLSKLTDGRELLNWGNKPGSRRPTVCYCFDIGATLRALVKISLNLLAGFCHRTPVNHETFGTAMRIVRGEIQVTPKDIRQNGFVYAEDVQDISASGNDHAFRLVHMDDTWHVFSSFFGGKVGTYVAFRGPNQEDWRSAHLVAPLRSKNWTIQTSPLLTAKNVRVSWQGSNQVMPSFKLRDSLSSVSVSLAEQKRLAPKASA